jgi:hypothetical protein
VLLSYLPMHEIGPMCSGKIAILRIPGDVNRAFR